MSWHYLRAQGAASSEDCCTGGEPLPPLKSKTTHAEFYCNGKLTESYLGSLCGTMYGRSMGESGGGESMSSAAGSLAKTSVAQTGTLKELRENDPDYGEKCAGSFARLDLDSYSWKTAQCSLFGDLESFSETWPYQGMMLNGIACVVRTSAGTIPETGCGLLPTPRVSMGKPCPKRIGPDSEEYRHNIEEYLGGKPNPTFCEWMMGWPLMWTDVTRPLATDKFQQWLRSHGKCSEGR